MSSGVPAATMCAAAVAAFGPEIEDPVGCFDHLKIVLDHHDSIALVDQRVQHLQQLAHVLEMQARGRLVQYIQRAAGRAPCEFLRPV